MNPQKSEKLRSGKNVVGLIPAVSHAKRVEGRRKCNLANVKSR